MIKRVMVGFSGLVSCKLCRGTGVRTWFDFADATSYSDICHTCDGSGDKVIK